MAMSKIAERGFNGRLVAVRVKVRERNEVGGERLGREK